LRGRDRLNHVVEDDALDDIADIAAVEHMRDIGHRYDRGAKSAPFRLPGSTSLLMEWRAAICSMNCSRKNNDIAVSESKAEKICTCVAKMPKAKTPKISHFFESEH